MGGLLLLAGIVVTVAVEVPMNKQVVTWVAVRDRWWWFHVVRTVLGVVGFVFAVCGLGWR